MPPTYDLTTEVTLVGENFISGTFARDAKVSFALGLTSGIGYITDWVPATGGTNGAMRLSGVQGTVLAGQLVEYQTFGPSGTIDTVSGTIPSVTHMSELKYRSGEVLYIQNIKPVMRNIEQREEIKLVIEL